MVPLVPLKSIQPGKPGYRKKCQVGPIVKLLENRYNNNKEKMVSSAEYSPYFSGKVHSLKSLGEYRIQTEGRSRNHSGSDSSKNVDEVEAEVMPDDNMSGSYTSQIRNTDGGQDKHPEEIDSEGSMDTETTSWNLEGRDQVPIAEDFPQCIQDK